MKKLIVIALSAMMLFAFTACNLSSATETTVFTLTEETVKDFRAEGVQSLTDGALAITPDKGWQLDLNTVKYNVEEGKDFVVEFTLDIEGTGAKYVANTLVMSEDQTSMETYPVTLEADGTYTITVRYNGIKGIEVSYNNSVVAADTDSIHYVAGADDTKAIIGIGGWVEGEGATAKITNFTITQIL